VFDCLDARIAVVKIMENNLPERAQRRLADRFLTAEELVQAFSVLIAHICELVCVVLELLGKQFWRHRIVYLYVLLKSAI
jgi:hypothetical protein